MAKNKLSRSLVYKGFRKKLLMCFGKKTAVIWARANDKLVKFECEYPEIPGDAKMMILPAAAIYEALREEALADALPMMKEYGKEMGEKIAKAIHAFTSIPGLSRLLWRNMPKIMRKMSSPEKGYTRKIVSETNELVGVDILSCPLCDAAVRIGVPEAVQIVCAMDKAYMSGFKYICYTRTTSVGEGDECCDYRLTYDKNKQ